MSGASNTPVGKILTNPWPQAYLCHPKSPIFLPASRHSVFTSLMRTRRAALLMMAALALVPSAFAGGKKEPKVAVSFHMETEATDNPKMIFPFLANGKERFFRRLPEISLKDVVSFNPFPSEFGGGDYGIVFRLKGSASNRFAAITTANSGRWMISQINGRIVDGFLIDKPVGDGQIVIWKGVTLEDVALLDAELPRMGQEGQKKKK